MMTIIQAKSENDLTLGRQGENLARQVVFDLSAWEAEYGPGVAELIHQRPGDAAPYPVAAVREGGTLVWTLTSADTDFHSDYGSCELRYYVGDVLVKSRTWLTKVIRAMSTPSETAPPEPEQGWVDQVVAVGAAAKASADAAKADADRAADLAAEVAAKAAQTAQNASDTTKAKEAAEEAKRLAEAAQKAAETAKSAAEKAQSAAEQSATDADAAKQAAESALKATQDAAAEAAQSLADLRALYERMREWAAGVIQTVNDAGSAAVQSVQSAGDAQVQRVTDEGTTQTANAKAQADAAAKAAAGAAQYAQEAAESAAVYDDVVADVNQLKQDIADISACPLKEDYVIDAPLTVGQAVANSDTEKLSVGQFISDDNQKNARTDFIMIPLGSETIDSNFGIGGSKYYGWCLYNYNRQALAAGKNYPIELENYPDAKFIAATNYSASLNHAGKTLTFRSKKNLADIYQKVEASFQSLGYIRSGDANTLTERGYYYVNCIGVGIANLPVQTYGILGNFYDDTGRSVQFLMDSKNGYCYFRNKTSTGVYGPWHSPDDPFSLETNVFLIGDSFSVGRYSYYDADRNAVTDTDENEGWFTKLFKQRRKYGTVTNLAHGGMGWKCPTTTDGYTAYSIIESTDFTDATYVVMWLGINDYNTNQPLGTVETATAGDGTVCGEIIRCIEALTAKTKAPLYLITPINCRQRSGASVETHYSLDLKNAAGYTLRELAKTIEYYADFYGVNVVDLTEHCSINQTNIVEYLPDEVHPTLYGHTLLARELDEKLSFR